MSQNYDARLAYTAREYALPRWVLLLARGSNAYQ